MKTENEKKTTFQEPVRNIDEMQLSTERKTLESQKSTQTNRNGGKIERKGNFWKVFLLSCLNSLNTINRLHTRRAPGQLFFNLSFVAFQLSVQYISFI